MGELKIGKKNDFPLNKPTRVRAGEHGICVVQSDGRFYAFDDQCTHAYAILSEGELEGNEITCPLHGARFSIETGEPLTLPAVKPVRVYEVRVEGEDVLVQMD